MPDLDGRLQQRYLKLVMEHLSPAQRLAAGLRALPAPAQPFASTQAAWRFYANPHSTLPQLAQQVESWQQETAEALARRLMVAAMAAVVVWRLARDGSAQGRELREVLVKLSGRQMKRGRRFTESALLAGLGILIPMLALLDHYDLADLRRLKVSALPWLHREGG